MLKKNNILRLFCLLLVSCGAQYQSEDYGLSEASQLQLTELNHPHGYGQENCFSCHVPRNLHQEDHQGFDSLTARYLVETQGLKSCVLCHGNNGVSAQ